MSEPLGAILGGGLGEPLGAILAGGPGRRIGGAKAIVELGGRPLISYPLGAMAAVVGEVVVVAKPDTALPELGDAVRVWREPPEPRHPLAGIRAALSLAAGQPVLVCAADMPFVSTARLAELAADPRGAPAVVAAHRGALQPLLGCYRPEALARLPVDPGDRPLRELVAAIGPRTFEVADRLTLFNVNTPEDLARAEALLAGVHNRPD